MIDQFDKTDHTREYELKQKEHLERFLSSKKYDDNGHLNLGVIEDIKAEAIKEGKRLGKEELLKELAEAATEVEKKIEFVSVPKAENGGFCDITGMDYAKGFKLLKTILTGE